ncbi:hypothetical protein AVEN_174930-1 [Araneus ventricosus]|uniref:Mariner Mos1 transposase n=1 Tax=Araneus ventricosus TaxID=182803 RepID=A0A4Y2X6K2_ARAVE|nr:hypothetical protein AVEN_174930-1 [Araneus ventricosus]
MVYRTRPESRTASQAENCLQKFSITIIQSRISSLESNLFESENDLPFFCPEFQLKNTFDPALRGMAERLSFGDLSGDETVSPTTNLCSLSRIFIGKSHNVMRFSSSTWVIFSTVSLGGSFRKPFGLCNQDRFLRSRLPFLVRFQLAIWGGGPGRSFSGEFGGFSRPSPHKAESYCETLRGLLKAVKNKGRGKLSKGIVLLHDNERLHKARTTQGLLRTFGWEVWKHPPYTPDMAPCDCHIFNKLKEHLGGRQLSNDDQVQTDFLS